MPHAYMTKIIDVIQTIVEFLAALALLSMVVLGLLAVVFRFVIESSLDFAEPAMLLLFLWTMCLGCFTGFRKRMHPAILTLQQKLPGALGSLAEVFTLLASAVFFCVLLRYGWAFTERTVQQVSSTLGISMGWLNAAVPVMAVLLLLCVVERLSILRANHRQSSIEPQRN